MLLLPSNQLSRLLLNKCMYAYWPPSLSRAVGPRYVWRLMDNLSLGQPFQDELVFLGPVVVEGSQYHVTWRSWVACRVISKQWGDVMILLVLDFLLYFVELSFKRAMCVLGFLHFFNQISDFFSSLYTYRHFLRRSLESWLLGNNNLYTCSGGVWRVGC